MGSIRCYLEQLHFNLFDLRSITLFYKDKHRRFSKATSQKRRGVPCCFGKKEAKHVCPVIVAKEPP
jgi:hypothetical protein